MKTHQAVQPRSECVFSNALEIFGDKWTLLIVRDMFFFNKHEYKEFLSSPESIATNILSDRLKRLVASDIVAERLHSDNRSRKLYFLTDKGKDLLPVLMEVAKWGRKYFPDLPAMQELYQRIEMDELAVRDETIDKIKEWEELHL